MTTYRFLIATIGLGFLTLGQSLFASDHADPQNVLNPFQPQDAPAANLTDLDSFLADKSGRPIVEDITIADPIAREEEVKSRIAQADQLIVAICVRRRLLPAQIGALESKEDLSKYAFRVHLDLNPALRHFNADDTQKAIEALDAKIAAQTAVRNQAHKASPPMGPVLSADELAEQAKLNDLLAQRGRLYTQRQQDDLMERLYGGIIDRPESIAEEATLDFHLELKEDKDFGANSEAVIVMPRVEGIPGRVNVVTAERKTIKDANILVEENEFKSGMINVQGGVFDDPFIFPRFYRGNVVGIVVSIPLDSIRQPGGAPVRGQPILLWATTHKPGGEVSDHVGRSLRTQLPRFGYLNALHPSRHAAEILRVHGQPTLMENILTAFIAPLEAHRHYDTAPDVMIYDLALPTKFPNGRWFADDVSKTLADNGETLLLELACSESRQTPRATTNDKPFYATFPYLASRWTAPQIAEHAGPGSSFGELTLGNYKVIEQDAKIAGTFTALKGQRVPDAQDPGATAMPDLNPAVWSSLLSGLTLLLLIALLAALRTARSPWGKFLVLVFSLFVCCYLHGWGYSWLRCIAAGILILGAVVALIAARKLLQRCTIVLVAIALLCALWPTWWTCLKTGYLIAVAVLMGGYFFTSKGLSRRLLVLLLGGLVLWGLYKWTPAAPMMPAIDTPNEHLRRFIFAGLMIFALGLFALYAWGVRRGIKRAALESLPELGDQREVQADHQYAGSSFDEVRSVVFKNPYYGPTWGTPNQPPLPIEQVTTASIARGMFSLSKRFLFRDAATRTLNSHADLRGHGPGENGVRRILHPNGICLTGTWEITEETPYTGFFAKGSKGLVITRYSSGLGVRRGEKRTLSMVGKLYPTLDRSEVHRTASFITQDDLGAAYPDSIHDVNLRNAPNVTVSKRFPDLGSLFLIGFTFFRVDMRNTIRQLYEIAELVRTGDPKVAKTICPQFMQLRVLSDKVGGGDDTADFRDEILAHVYQRGTQKKLLKPLVFGIEVSDEGEVRGALDKKLEDTVWRLIGTITIDEAVASPAADRVIHFHHPKWREDVNRPDSETGASKAAHFLNKLGDIYQSVLRFLFRRKRVP